MDLLTAALRDYGIAELAGSAASPDIMAMAAALEVGSAYPSDETPWCGLAMAHWVTSAGGTPPGGFLAARSWLSWGQSVDKPSLGDVCVLWRVSPTGWNGHVALFISQRDGHLFLLGGNQGDRVSIARFPAAQLLGVRRG